MFTEKVRFLLSQLEASNSDIAQQMKVNPSIISRLRTGSSKPKKESQAIRHFLEGIYGFALENNRLRLLASIIGLDASAQEDDYKAALLSWLYSNEGTKLEINSQASSLFGEKLTSLMQLLDLSNVKLARSITIDPSYISHFKSGSRTPHTNNRILNDICQALAEQVLIKNKYTELAQLLLLSKPIPKDREGMKSLLISWLTDHQKEVTPSPVGSLFEYINNLEPSALPLPSIEEVVSEELFDNSLSIYEGLEGFRQAVIRFLATSAQKGEELWLYSDQSLDWMTQDKHFLLKWAALMNHCIQSGIRIKIIHNINRDFSEMIAAIKGWAPLYMSGMIEPYFCKKEPDVRFSNTLFLCPNTCAIEATHVRGFEQNGIYDFRTDPIKLASMEKQFKGLLQDSIPLLRVLTEKEHNHLLFSLSNQPIETGTCILTTLPTSTMPEELVDRILENHSFTAKEKKTFLTFCKVQRDHLFECLEAGISYTHCLPLLRQESVLDNPPLLDLHNIVVNKEIAYTAGDYCQNLQHIYQIYQTYDNFQILPLEKELFHNIQIKVGQRHVILLKHNPPRIAFVFTNPAMQVVFQNYLNQIVDMHQKDKEEVLEQLQSVLKSFD